MSEVSVTVGVPCVIATVGELLDVVVTLISATTLLVVVLVNVTAAPAAVPAAWPVSAWRGADAAA